MGTIRHHDPATRAIEAIAHPARLAIVQEVVNAGEDGMASGVIARRLGISAAAASHHLSWLINAGLLDTTRVGRSIVYSAAGMAIHALLLDITSALGARPRAVSSALGRRATPASVPAWTALRMDDPPSGSIVTRIDVPHLARDIATAPYSALLVREQP